MRKEIVMLGDSWFAGVYDSAGNTIGSGLENYFCTYGFITHNLSKPGASNKDSINRLEKYLLANSGDNKIFFMVQTDPFRSIRPYDNFTNLIIENKGFMSARSYVRKLDYSRLEKICNTYNIQVNLIGGLSAVIPDEINNKTVLVPLVPSWPELLLGSLDEYSNINWKTFGSWGSDWTMNSISINYLMNDHALMEGTFDNLGEKVIKELIALDDNNKVFEHYYFQPDNAHPNEEAHQILFKHLIKLLNL
jgi:lysophospholipase L1-like esterase